MKKERSFGRLKFLLVSILAVFFVWFVWTAPTLAAEKPIKIGVCLARTGPFTSLVAFLIDGLKLSLDEAGGKVAGKSFEVVWEDEGPGDPAFVMDKMRKLVESDKVDIIIGPFNSDLRLPTLAYTSKKKIPSFAVVCDDEGALKFPYAYAFNQTTFQEARPVGWYAYDQLKVKTVNAIGGDWHAGHAFIEGFTQGFTKERKGEVLSQQFPPLGTTDFSSYIVAMKPADAIVLMSVPGDVGAFLSQAHGMGAFKNTKVINIGQSVLPPMLKDIGPMMIGNIWQHAEYQPFYKGPANKKFNELYQAKFGHPAGSFEGCGYAVGSVVLEALRITKGDTNPDKIHEAVKSIKMDTPLGKLSFVPGNADKSGVEGILSRFIEVIKQGKDGYYWDLAYEYPSVKPAPIMK
ncbi:MAG TPA: ABC transporter substrate-binding protein [Syntrophorhabdales bacterium]|nr:ABC transporter substrate-binding protein [Syntrophorhabdales bacterium]